MNNELFPGEKEAIEKVTTDYGPRYGFGNLIAALRRAWADHLIETYGFDEDTADRATIVAPYPRITESE